jgi:hypothetical protein
MSIEKMPINMSKDIKKQYTTKKNMQTINKHIEYKIKELI